MATTPAPFVSIDVAALKRSAYVAKKKTALYPAPLPPIGAPLAVSAVTEEGVATTTSGEYFIGRRAATTAQLLALREPKKTVMIARKLDPKVDSRFANFQFDFGYAPAK